MKLETTITVGNNGTLGFNNVKATTRCVGFIELFVPQPDGSTMEIELKRTELIEFLVRTQPNMDVCLRVGVHGGDKSA